MLSEILQITSRAGIVYKGQLHSIDTKHSTVTLKKVLLDNGFNAETRDLGKPQFDYVIFRGSDIGDVKLCIDFGRETIKVQDNAIVHFEYQKLTNEYPCVERQNKCFACINPKHDPAIVRVNEQSTNVCPVKSYDISYELRSNKETSLIDVHPLEKDRSESTTGKAVSLVAVPFGDNTDISVSNITESKKESDFSKESGHTFRKNKNKSERAHSSEIIHSRTLSTVSKQVTRSHSLNKQTEETKGCSPKSNQSTEPTDTVSISSMKSNPKRSTKSSVNHVYQNKRSFFDNFTASSNRIPENGATFRRTSTTELTSLTQKKTNGSAMRKSFSANAFTNWSYYYNFLPPSAPAYPSYESTANGKGDWMMIHTPQPPFYRVVPTGYQQCFTDPINRMMVDPGSLVGTYNYPTIYK